MIMRSLFVLLCLASTLAHAETSSPAPAAGEWGLPQLMQSLAQVKSSSGKFVERKYLSVLNQPLEFSGTISFRAPDHLEKHTLLPKAEDLVLDQGVLTIDSKARNIRRTLVLQEYPAVWAFVESIRSTLAGDLPTLQRFYKIKLEGNAAKWRMQLLPVEQRTREMVREIDIGGHGNHVASIEMRESNGDRSAMTVVESAP
jgi:Outer membrane lipoprotein carrier protein LolA-like